MHYNLKFLELFTKELIINSTPVYIKEKLEEDREKIKKVAQQVKREVEQNILLEPGMEPSIMHLNDSPAKNLEFESEPIEKEDMVVSREELYLGPLTRAVYDENVTSIECSGPNKFVTIHTYSRTIPSRIQLSEEEINAVIESFSYQSRIPRIGGVFKAIVNNLIITAIDTDISERKFIITKIHPHTSEFL